MSTKPISSEYGIKRQHRKQNRLGRMNGSSVRKIHTTHPYPDPAPLADLIGQPAVLTKHQSPSDKIIPPMPATGAEKHARLNMKSIKEAGMERPVKPKRNEPSPLTRNSHPRPDTHTEAAAGLTPQGKPRHADRLSITQRPRLISSLQLIRASAITGTYRTGVKNETGDHPQYGHCGTASLHNHPLDKRITRPMRCR